MGYGVSRVINMDKDKNIDIVPADYVINSTIVAAWKTSCEREHRDRLPKIYTVSSARNPLSISKEVVISSDFRILI